MKKILLAHGGGGRWTRELIQDLFFKAFENPILAAEHDSAVLPASTEKLAFTTDSYVVRPLFFPGGDIGSLAVYGTINDLAMSGAQPRYLSASFILEEGFPLEDLQRIVNSMQSAANQCQVQIVTGDTKVVERGKGDGLFINTAGIGFISHSQNIQPSSVRTGDSILVSGDLGRHGIAIMAAREALDFKTHLESDCAPLASMVLDLLQSGVEVHCLRDLTRGGLASAVNEIAMTCNLEMLLDEEQIPIGTEVRGACELLGLDPFYVANEGRLIAFVPKQQTSLALKIIKRHEAGVNAKLIGKVSQNKLGRVVLKSTFGQMRLLEMMSGEQLPRIC